MSARPLGWLGILRLGLVQTALGSIVVLSTSTLNRVMVVELALAALLPGALVGIHYAMQLLRPRLGHGSDVGGRRAPWIVGGMAVLATGGVGAAVATAWMSTALAWGIALAVLSFVAIGVGVGACGTTLLVLLAKRVEPGRRAPAATIVWVMMILGFIVTTAVAGQLLDPYSPTRLVTIAAAVSAASLAITLFAVRGMDAAAPDAPAEPSREGGGFRLALAQVWGETRSRRFAVFVFVSMLAFSAQDLILEPFAGLVFSYSVGESTKLSSVQNGGVLAGMVVAALACGAFGGSAWGSLRAWTIGGCIASALALLGLVVAGFAGPPWPLAVSVFALGLANGAYAVAAIGSMMGLVHAGRAASEGIRMGIWGAAQAIAFGVGGFVGAVSFDLARALLGSPVTAYAAVFGAEALLFAVAAVLAALIDAPEGRRRPDIGSPAGRPVASGDD